MSKYAAISTLDYRLSMMGFSHPDSTKTKEYTNKQGDVVVRCCSLYGVGWYLFACGDNYIKAYSFSKRLLVQQMEESGEYNV